MEQDRYGFVVPHTNYVGLRNGKCVFIAVKMANVRENAKVVGEMVRKGLDVLTVPHSDCGPYLDQLREQFQKPAKKQGELL